MTYTNKNGETLALTMSKQDKYHPKKTGVFGAFASAFNNKNKAQMFSYDEKKDIISPLALPNYAITSGIKHEIYAFNNYGLMNQKYQINTAHHKVYSEFTGRALHLFERSFFGAKDEKGQDVTFSKGYPTDPRITGNNWLA